MRVFSETGLESQYIQGGDDREAKGPKQVHVGDGAVEEGFFVKHLPAELVFVEKNGTAAGVAAVDYGKIRVRLSGPRIPDRRSHTLSAARRIQHLVSVNFADLDAAGN
jgi:hypothetical protein